MDLVAERVKDRKVLRLVSAFLRAGVVEMHGGFAETLTGTPQGGVASPLLANIHLSVLDRHFSRIWDAEMTQPWRRRYRRRMGRPNFRLVRDADDFIVLVHGTKPEAEALKAEIGKLLAAAEPRGCSSGDQIFSAVTWMWSVVSMVMSSTSDVRMVTRPGWAIAVAQSMASMAYL